MVAEVKIGKISKKIQLSPTLSIHDALVENGLFLSAPCGGRGICGKCKARLISADFDLKTDENGYFLTCKCFPKGNISFEIFQDLTYDFDFKLLQEFLGESLEVLLDLGTTTLCFCAVDEKGEKVAELSVLNPQRVLGADVLSRISYCAENDVYLAHKLIIDVIGKAIDAIIEKTKIKEVFRLKICGNTVMTHILMNVNPKPIGNFPFQSVFSNEIRCQGKELGLNVNEVLVLPTFNPFIGGDIVSGVGFLKLGKTEENQLLVDVGTNGEMVLYANGKYYCTSTSAGPAFEGGKIECGIGGISGAVCKVYEKAPFWAYETIDNCEVIGICGAGILDFVSCALKSGSIDETGKIIAGKTGVKGDKIYLTKDIFLSQSDVREIQLAKSAIRCGIDALLDKAGLSYNDLDRLYLTGGMGCKLDVLNACRIGLIPFELMEKCKQKENTALSGLNDNLDMEIVAFQNNFLSNAEYVELSLTDDFDAKFIENLNFK